MPRIFKYGDILNITFTADKELNILIYRSPSYLIIYKSHALLKMVRFLAHPVFGKRSSELDLSKECLIVSIKVIKLPSAFHRIVCVLFVVDEVYCKFGHKITRYRLVFIREVYVLRSK